VRPGKGGRKPFWSANSKIERAGKKRAAWWKTTESTGHAVPIAMTQVGVFVSNCIADV
jgi:hypothetical protein